jgi:hypothetical protein
MNALRLFTAAATCLWAGAVFAAASVGQPAPAFTTTDTAGRSVSLADFKGKTVVLEWVNPGCPYVRKHYGSGNMPATQKDAAAAGVVWLSINSTAKDASDYQPPAELAKWMASQQAAPSATLMDESGRIGQAYGARTTPHMYVIDTRGVLAYAGAIDSKPSANPADIPGATNYVKQALGELRAGKAVSQPVTRAYGCSVKYASGA